MPLDPEHYCVCFDSSLERHSTAWIQVLSLLFVGSCLPRLVDTSHSLPRKNPHSANSQLIRFHSSPQWAFCVCTFVGFPLMRFSTFWERTLKPAQHSFKWVCFLHDIWASMWMDREIRKNTELRLFAEKIESFYAIQLNPFWIFRLLWPETVKVTSVAWFMRQREDHKMKNIPVFCGLSTCKVNAKMLCTVFCVCPRA